MKEQSHIVGIRGGGESGIEIKVEPVMSPLVDFCLRESELGEELEILGAKAEKVLPRPRESPPQLEIHNSGNFLYLDVGCDELGESTEFRRVGR
jgi:hypothetical protein